MASNDIVCIVNGNTYILNARNPSALSQVPEAERNQLIQLLKALKRQSTTQEDPGQFYAHPDTAAKTPRQPPSKPAPSPAVASGSTGRKLSEAEIGHLMAQLAMEERGRDRTSISKRGVYVFLFIVMMLILLLALIP